MFLTLVVSHNVDADCPIAVPFIATYTVTLETTGRIHTSSV